MTLQNIVALADSDENSEIDISEFMKYMANHEKKLKLAFNRLDRNNDGITWFLQTIEFSIPLNDS